VEDAKIKIFEIPLPRSFVWPMRKAKQRNDLQVMAPGSSLIARAIGQNGNIQSTIS
jgi:hypothetical protein